MGENDKLKLYNKFLFSIYIISIGSLIAAVNVFFPQYNLLPTLELVNFKNDCMYWRYPLNTFVYYMKQAKYLKAIYERSLIWI